MHYESLDSVESTFFVPAELEVDNQRKLIALLKERKDTQDPEVQVLLQKWIAALDSEKVSDLLGCFLQAQLYAKCGMTEKALAQVQAIFDRLDQTAPDNRSEGDRAIANAAIDLEEELLR